ncbi:AAA family ATPase [Arthrobacter sp. NPDC097144]|uniref:AAA family ATPase n=1 Tax=Arthrobacter sp. NPDC097144 TaxID=3363946 RepID=UPI003817BC3F
MPDFILLNGPPGIGKSTLARLFADRHPGTLNLDVDQVRCLIGGWQQDFQTAGELVRPLVRSMAAAHLSAGHCVIMPQFLDAAGEVADLQAVAEASGSTFREVVLLDSKERSLGRFAGRGTGNDDPWHDTVRNIVDQGGGTLLLEFLYDNLVDGLAERPEATVIRSTGGAVEATYSALLDALSPE